MDLTSADLTVILLYFIISFGFGLFFSRRAGRSLSEYFLAGRRTPWLLAGVGMVATTFAADTPLWVAGQVARHGVAGNWLWWSYAAGGMLTVFFFARLWRRAGVLTDLELIELRYSGRLANFLRSFRSIYFGLILNAIVIGWVNLAMLKILEITLPVVDGQVVIDPRLALVLCAVLTTIYVTVAGLWGVALADAFQFVVALGGCIVLAVYAASSETIVAAGGLVNAAPENMLNFLPDFTASLPENSNPILEKGSYALPFLSFLAFIGLQWWATWYPGAEPGGGGYIAQRIMSTRDEKNSLLAALFFVVAHYCIRSWPWIVAGIAAAILYPGLEGADTEKGFVYLMRDVLPSPLKGLLLAAFAGAYMSTISTQLNWGGSYLVNDLYRRYLKPDGSTAHYILISRLSTVLLLVVALSITFFVLESISGAWEFLIEFGAGTGFVLILRWYWWRLNAAAELASMLSSMVVVLLLRLVIPDLLPPDSSWQALTKFPFTLFSIVFFNLIVTMAVTFLTQPTSMERLTAFYKRVQPGGPGWKPVRAVIEKSEELPPARTLWPSFIGWLAGTALVYVLLFAIGSLILGDPMIGVTLFGIAGGLSFVIAKVIKREFAE